MRKFLLFTVVLSFSLMNLAMIGFVTNSYAETTVIQPGPSNGKDTQVTELLVHQNTNMGFYQNFKVGGWGNLNYVYIQFDLTGLPEVATSAKVQLYCHGNFDEDDNIGSPPEIYVHQITSSWGEMTATWNIQPSTVDLGITLEALDSPDWVTIDITELYNSWKNDTYENYGIALIPVSIANEHADFHSSENLDYASERPKLVIESTMDPTITLQDAIFEVNDIDVDNFKNKNMQNTLTNKIMVVIKLIANGQYAEALDKLQYDILGKTDGCANDGTPDNNDWIEDCTSQDQIYPLVIEAIEYLQKM